MKILAGLGLTAFAFSMATAAYGQQLPGISVSGTANISISADSLTYNMRIATRSSQMKITDQMLAPIQNALRLAGASPNGAVRPQIFSTLPTNIAILRGTLEAPTSEKLQAGTALLADAFMTNPDLLFQDGSIVASLKDCQALRFRAEAVALRDARTRAARLAQMSGVSLGRLIALSSNMIYGGPNSFGCSTAYSLNEFEANPSLSGIERFLKVNMFATVNATYSIR